MVNLKYIATIIFGLVAIAFVIIYWPNPKKNNNTVEVRNTYCDSVLTKGMSIEYNRQTKRFVLTKEGKSAHQIDTLVLSTKRLIMLSDTCELKRFIKEATISGIIKYE
jgi:hypothetical protein